MLQSPFITQHIPRTNQKGKNHQTQCTQYLSILNSELVIIQKIHVSPKL